MGFIHLTLKCVRYREVSGHSQLGMQPHTGQQSDAQKEEQMMGR